MCSRVAGGNKRFLGETMEDDDAIFFFSPKPRTILSSWPDKPKYRTRAPPHMHMFLVMSICMGHLISGPRTNKPNEEARDRA